MRGRPDGDIFVGMLRAVLSVPRALRIFSVILAVAAMLCVSAVSVSAAHTHLKEPVDRCNVCCTAHQAAQQVVVVHVVHALELQSLMARPVSVQRVEAVGVLAFSTRGPPSFTR